MSGKQESKPSRQSEGCCTYGCNTQDLPRTAGGQVYVNQEMLDANRGLQLFFDSTRRHWMYNWDWQIYILDHGILT